MVIIGVVAQVDPASPVIHDGLDEPQHRGQDAGIVTRR